MKYKQYSPEIWAQIHAATEKAIARDPHPVAAFDADGTLWDTDFGENYFRHKIDRKVLNLPEDPWNYYVQLKKKNNDPREAYLWLAQIMKGQTLEQARTWALDAAMAQGLVPIFPDQRKLIEYLKSKGVRVMIVTASVRWAVEPGAEVLGLTHDDVVGVETAVDNGTITDRAAGHMTYRKGKADAILSVAGKAPFLVCGNTMGDFELLKSATDIRLAVSAAHRDDELFRTETELAKTARENGWLVHRWVDGN